MMGTMAPGGGTSALSGGGGRLAATADGTLDLDALLRVCIHCGLCLSNCPTYLVTGDEADSPRGRLMVLGELERSAGVAAPVTAPSPLGSSSSEDAARLRVAGDSLVLREPLDRCLGCLHCETVCPSGVSYGALLDAARQELGPPPGFHARLVVWLVDHVLSRPRRLLPVARIGYKLAHGFLARLLPSSLRRLVGSVPARKPDRPPSLDLPEHGDVALLAGCAQQVYGSGVLPAVARLVEAVGLTPGLPPKQSCCGALSYHAGSVKTAKALARRLIDAMDGETTILVPSAGCSAHMRRYGELFADDPQYAEKAARVAAATVDVVEWLDRHSEALRFKADRRRIVYHPPCHHTHAQGIVDEPLRLLARVPDIELLELRDADRCCGSAGAYSMLHPELAEAIRAEKLERLAEGEPDLILTANPGCELFIESGIEAAGGSTPIRHLVEYLAERLD